MDTPPFAIGSFGVADCELVTPITFSLSFGLDAAMASHYVQSAFWDGVRQARQLAFDEHCKPSVN